LTAKILFKNMSFGYITKTFFIKENVNFFSKFNSLGTITLKGFIEKKIIIKTKLKNYINTFSKKDKHVTKVFFYWKRIQTILGLVSYITM